MLRTLPPTQETSDDHSDPDSKDWMPGTRSAGTKRLFSDRQLPQMNTPDSARFQDAANDEEQYTDDEETQSGKRPRTSNWPLKDTSTVQPQTKSPSRPDSYAPPSSTHRKPSLPRRMSRFQEGSLNDRTSKRPPPEYLGDEFGSYTADNYDNSSGGSTARKYTRGSKYQNSNTTSQASLADRSDGARQSGIFRFGRSLAASFNPANWKIWSKANAEEEFGMQNKVLTDQQMKAEQIYREMKQSGQFQEFLAKGPRKDEHLPDNQMDHTRARHSTLSRTKHDSGVHFEQHPSTHDRTPQRTSNLEKRYGRIFMDPPDLSRERSLESDNASTSNFTDHYRQTSTTSLNNFEPRFSSSVTTFDSQNHFTPNNNLRSMPSKKELQKQQKLVKRVSNLESKLQAAKRSLADALGDANFEQPLPPPPKYGSRRTFKPMASLPSERLLNTFGTEDEAEEVHDPDSASEIGQAFSRDYTPRQESVMERSVESDSINLESQPSLKLKSALEPNLQERDRNIQSSRSEHEYQQAMGIKSSDQQQLDNQLHVSVEKDTRISKPTHQVSKKRKSIGEGISDDGGLYKPSADDEDDDEDQDGGEWKPKRVFTPSKKSPAKPRKVQKTSGAQSPSVKPSDVPVISIHTPGQKSTCVNFDSLGVASEESALDDPTTPKSSPLVPRNGRQAATRFVGNGPHEELASLPRKMAKAYVAAAVGTPQIMTSPLPEAVSGFTAAVNEAIYNSKTNGAAAVAASINRTALQDTSAHTPAPADIPPVPKIPKQLANHGVPSVISPIKESARQTLQSSSVLDGNTHATCEAVEPMLATKKTLDELLMQEKAVLEKMLLGSKELDPSVTEMQRQMVSDDVATIVDQPQKGNEEGDGVRMGQASEKDSEPAAKEAAGHEGQGDVADLKGKPSFEWPADCF